MALTTSSLIQEINKGNLALPDFQRDYKWHDDFIVELLRSIARGWPIGSFLMLEQNGKTRLLSREIKGAPKARSKPQHLILDGQQRATALYQSLTGKGERKTTFYVDMTELRGSNEVTDEAIDALPDRQFEREYGKGIDSHAEAGVIRMQDLVSSSAFASWLTHVSESKAEQTIYADLKDQHLANLTGYALRTEPVSSDLPMEAIAKIFERTNRSVLQLDAFDLMVAILYPHDFNLRKRWDAAKSSSPILSTYEVAGVEVLKVIALREHLKQREELDAQNIKKLTVRGVRQSDVLALDPKLVIKEWNKAVKAYGQAIQFLRDDCGAIRRKIVPQHTVLLPIADALYGRRKALSSASRRKLRRWFWAVSFERLYARGANTRAVTDAHLLRKWLGRGGKTPDLIAEFSISDDAFHTMDDGNDLAVAATLCLLNTLDARDWATQSAKGGRGRRLIDTPESTELGIHHVFPLEFLASRIKRPRMAAEIPANQVLIDAGLNSSIRNSPPSSVMKSKKIVLSAIKSHLIDPSTTKKDRYEPFIKHRSAQLAIEARRAVNPAP
jgi:hypothetical protein